MEFSFDRFYRLNRRVIIWVILFGFIWLLRDFFTLIFLTFIIGFFAAPATRFLVERLRLPRLAAINLIYLTILASFAALVVWVSPKLVTEFGNVLDKLPDFEKRLAELYDKYADETTYPNVAGLLQTYMEERQFDQLITEQKRAILERLNLPEAARRLALFGLNFLLATLFSYLITLDYFRLARVLASLKSSKLRDFYEETGAPVVRFALSIGRGFQAIVVIALITTVFATIVMLGFRLPNLALLASIVFFTSLIPIIGVVFEMVPIGLVALNTYGIEGLTKTVWILVAIGAVHAVITYAIAPVIFGRQFRLNPVLVLLFLFLGGQVFGLWGVILAIPVANYLIRDVFAVPIVEELEEGREAPRAITIKPDDRAAGLQPKKTAPPLQEG